MTTLPTWANTDWAGKVDEPFRSDREFWSGLAATADALVSLVLAVVVAIGLAVAHERFWALVPFIVPTALTIRAAMLSAASSRRSRETFADRRAWRDAERAAVASVFFKVLRRPRRPAQASPATPVG